MANDRLNYEAPFVSAKEMPEVNVDTGTARYMNTLSNVFLTNANEAHKRQLQSDLELAQSEGQRVGWENGKNFQPMKGSSLFERQYNDSGVSTALENIQIDTQQAATSYFKANKMNPTGLAKALDSYTRGYTDKLAPELRTPVQMHMGKLGAGLVAQATENLRTFNLQKAAEQFEQYNRDMENTLEVVAQSMFLGGDAGRKAQESVAQLRQNYINTLAQHGPAGVYTAGGYTVNGSRSGSGALTVKDVSDKLRAFDMNVITSGVYGHYVQEAEAGRGVDAYMNFIKGNVEVSALNKDGKLESMKVSDYLTNDEMEKVASKMRQYSSGVDSMEEAVNRKWDRTRDRNTDAFLRMGMEAAFDVQVQPDGSKRIVGGDPVRLQAIIANGIVDESIKPEAVQQLQDLAGKLGNGDIDNPMISTEAKMGVADGTIQSYRDLPATGLSDKTRIELHQQIDSRLKGEDWTSSVRYRQANDYAEAMLAPEKSAGFNIFGDDQATKASAADLAEWKRRMITDAWSAQSSGLLPANPNAIPGKTQDGRAEFDFVQHGRELADEIAARRTKPAAKSPAATELDAKIKAVEDKMNNPQPGDDTKAVADEYRALMDQKAQIQAKELMTP